jgi:hypothetical protein
MKDSSRRSSHGAQEPRTERPAAAILLAIQRESGTKGTRTTWVGQHLHFGLPHGPLVLPHATRR